MSYHLIDIVQKLEHPRLLVLGDLILDRYIWGNAERISQEAPVILLHEERQEVRLGGAANVANLLRGLEAEVTMAGVVGDDIDANQMIEHLEKAGVDCSLLEKDSSRPTTVKERYIGRAQHRHPHQMLRVDREVRTPISGTVEEQFIQKIKSTIENYQAVLISDYAKGVCTPKVLKATIQAARNAGIPVIVDPASTGDCQHYRGATAITPNRLETSRATGQEVESEEMAFQAGRKLCEKLDLEYAFVTLDSDGIALVMKDGSANMYPTRKREVYDITGAGDMVLAMIGVAVAAGVNPPDLAKLANIAGGLEVEQIGVVIISREEILADLLTAGRSIDDKISSLETISHHMQARRNLGQKIVFTNGCFDVLHWGHVSYLQQAADEGDCLVVAVNSDSSVKKLNKAPNRPVFSEDERARMLAALEAIDYVLVFSEETPHAALEQIRPDLLVKGGTYGKEEIVGWEYVESYGGSVKALGIIEGLSSTSVIDRIQSTEEIENPIKSNNVMAPGNNFNMTDRKAG